MNTNTLSYIEEKTSTDLSKKDWKEIVDKVIENSQYEKFGARRVDKVIDEVVTSLIVDAFPSSNNLMIFSDKYISFPKYSFISIFFACKFSYIALTHTSLSGVSVS